MKIIGIVGSPRKEKGLTSKVIKNTLNGAAESGADTEIVYLRDLDPDYCIHCDFDCFSNLQCKQEKGLNTLFKKIEKADGIVLGGPVYIWQINALTVSFLEKMRLKTGPWSEDNNNNKSALGIAVAGGTGTGVFPALKSIYSFLNLWEFNPLQPIPVTRFNFDKALKLAKKAGTKMGKNSIKNITDTAEIMAAYDQLDYLNFSRADEFCWLARQIIQELEDNISVEKIDNLKSKLIEGNNFLEQNRGQAIKLYMETYKKARKIWESVD